MTYNFKKDETNSEITLKMSPSLIQDLVRRSQENGRDINLEIAIRLARTLEPDSVYPNDNDIITALKVPQKPKKG